MISKWCRKYTTSNDTNYQWHH